MQIKGDLSQCGVEIEKYSCWWQIVAARFLLRFTPNENSTTVMQ